MENVQLQITSKQEIPGFYNPKRCDEGLRGARCRMFYPNIRDDGDDVPGFPTEQPFNSQMLSDGSV